MTETMQSTEAPKARPTGPKMQTTANEIAVDIVAMHKWYGDFHVLRDINLRVKRGVLNALTRSVLNLGPDE